MNTKSCPSKEGSSFFAVYFRENHFVKTLIDDALSNTNTDNIG